VGDMLKESKQIVEKMMEDYQVKLTEFCHQELANILVQMIKSGDIVQHVQVDHVNGNGYAFSYVPYRGQNELRSRIQELEHELENIDDYYE